MSLSTISAMAVSVSMESDNSEKNRLNVLSEGIAVRPHICWSLGDDFRRSRTDSEPLSQQILHADCPPHG